ncbi:hypothetical protein TNCV_3543231 [Trichonephila clavipes]|nr:hypothetical protein TNCV_3543231 [Trichonephila clavipes]
MDCSIKYVVGTTSGCFYPRSNRGKLEDSCSVTSVASEFELLTGSFHDFGDNFKLQEQLSRGSVVVVHREPHPQMTGTLSYRPETGGRQREKSLDTRHRRLNDRYRVLPWPEYCTVGAIGIRSTLFDRAPAILRQRRQCAGHLRWSWFRPPY